MPRLRQSRASAGRPGARAWRGMAWLGERLLSRRGITVAGALAVTLSGAWLWHDGGVTALNQSLAQATNQAARAMGLRVESILVSGRQETSQAALLAAIGVRRGDSLVGSDTGAIRRQVEALPWVASAAVARHLPDTLYVTIAERRPVAFWQASGQLVLIDATGVRIEAIASGLPVPRRFAHLPVVAGDGGLDHLSELLAMMADAPDIASQVTGAVRVSERRWNLRLSTGVNLLLPEAGPTAALQRLRQVDHAHGLLSRDILSIDLRLPDRVIIRLPGVSATHVVAVGEDT
ncbi:MAG: FtsQ-type POTRA domain-containing protein [Alphaproteobacteria bacterium]